MTVKELVSVEELESLKAEDMVLSVASVQKVIEDKIKAVSEQYAAEIKAEQEALSAAKIVAEKLEKSLADMQAKLEAFEAEKVAKEREDVFNKRMAYLDSEFELDDEVRAEIASSIKDFGQEDFDKWFSSFSKFMKDKKKGFKKAGKMEKEEEKDSKASDILEAAKLEKMIIKNDPTQELSLMEKFANAFSKDKFKIKK